MVDFYDVLLKFKALLLCQLFALPHVFNDLIIETFTVTLFLSFQDHISLRHQVLDLRLVF